MTTATISTPFLSYFSNLINAADNLLGAVFLIKPSTFADSFTKALAISRMVGQNRQISPRKMQEIRKMLGIEPVAE